MHLILMNNEEQFPGCDCCLTALQAVYFRVVDEDYCLCNHKVELLSQVCNIFGNSVYQSSTQLWLS